MLIQHISPVLILLSTVLFISACASNANVGTETIMREETIVGEEAVAQQWNKNYREGLQYELFFRQLCVLGFGRFAENTRDEFHRNAWTLWAQLEEHATHVMAPVRQRNGVNPKAGFRVKAAAMALRGGMSLMPDVTLREAEASARRFIPQLRAIKATAPAQDQVQMDFMIEHELILIEFMNAYNRGDRDAAMAVFEAAMKQYYPSGYPRHRSYPVAL